MGIKNLILGLFCLMVMNLSVMAPPVRPQSGMTISDLKVCNMRKPLGIDVAPTFSWILAAYGRGNVQSAYRIIVSSTKKLAQAGTGDVWDSGKIDTDDTLDIIYRGKKLISKTTYYWTVEVWDGNGLLSAKSGVNLFTTGILTQAEWRGQWIGSPGTDAAVGNIPAVLLRKEFTVSKTIKEAYAYVCGLGYFDFKLNGNTPDNTVLNPRPSQYDKTVLYRTFDVAKMIKQGRNAIGIELGNSFFNETVSYWNFSAAPWRDAPKLLFNLEIQYEDGTRQTVVSDTSWKLTREGPTISNNVYYGDTYDARKEQTGFDKTGFNESTWKTASVMAAPPGDLRSHMRAPAERMGVYTPQKITKLSNGSYIITMDEFLFGWIKLSHINETLGKKLSITYGQKLNNNGAVFAWGPDTNSGHLLEANGQQDFYITKGTGNESFEPKFSAKSYRYIQIDGWSGNLTEDDVICYRISNGVEVISKFESSNTMFNDLHRNMATSIANNLQGENCDPFIEKMGWTGDANVSLPCMLYNFDMTASLPGWIQSMEDLFNKNGTVPDVVPNAGKNATDNSYVWNTIFAYGTKGLQDYFGQNSYAAKQYEVLRRFILKDINEMKSRNPAWVARPNQLGDWESPSGNPVAYDAQGQGDSEGAAIYGTAYVYGVLQFMKELAVSLGKTADANEYNEYMTNIYNAFNAQFYKSDRKIYESNTWRTPTSRTKYRQSSNLVPLAFGLAPEANRAAVVANLVKDIEEKGDHLDTGCVGTRHILPVLCDYGYADVAYRVMTQTTYPSWGYLYNQYGSVTQECWHLNPRSYDHYFLSQYDEWLFSHLGGIRDVKNGYKTFTLRPMIVGNGNLKWVNVFINTPRGLLESSWTLKTSDISLAYRITVPVGSTATVYLPAGNINNVKIDDTVINTSMGGIYAVDMENGQVKLTVGSGSYDVAVNKINQ